MPGSPDLERRIKSLVRWNAAAMVVRANKAAEGHRRPHLDVRLGGDAVRSRLQPFLPRARRSGDGDVIFFQGHAAPGIYARAYLEGRIDETHLENFRRELKAGGGLSSYPHPWLMPDFWEYPTVSMGLGPHDGDLPGALHALPRGSRAEAEVADARSGRSSATARPTSPNRSARSRCRRARSSTT